MQNLAGFACVSRLISCTWRYFIFVCRMPSNTLPPPPLLALFLMPLLQHRFLRPPLHTQQNNSRWFSSFLPSQAWTMHGLLSKLHFHRFQFCITILLDLINFQLLRYWLTFWMSAFQISDAWNNMHGIMRNLERCSWSYR